MNAGGRASRACTIPQQRRYGARPRRLRWRLVKRGFDLALLIALLPLSLPLFVACALAVAIDSSGPVIVSRRRTGLHGRRFDMYAFRTARWDPGQEPTRMGAVLACLRLQHLPQLLNIANGTMSFVGPRPTARLTSQFTPWQGERLEAKPGLTGLWQVAGRVPNFDERSRQDIAYIRNWSLWLDLKLLARTAVQFADGKCA